MVKSFSQYYLDISAKEPAQTDDKGNIKLNFEEIPDKNLRITNYYLC